MRFAEFSARLYAHAEEREKADRVGGIFVVRALGRVVPQLGLRIDLSRITTGPLVNPYIAIVSDRANDPVRRQHEAWLASSDPCNSAFVYGPVKHLAQTQVFDLRAAIVRDELTKLFPSYIQLAPCHDLQLPDMTYLDGDPTSLCVDGIPVISERGCEIDDMRSRLKDAVKTEQLNVEIY